MLLGVLGRCINKPNLLLSELLLKVINLLDVVIMQHPQLFVRLIVLHTYSIAQQ